MPPKRKRESLPLCGNPLYLNWVQQWEEEAKQRSDRNMRFIYKKAADSLMRYPIPFDHPREASILNGIGPKIVTQLEKRWAQHCTDHGIFNPASPPRHVNSESTSTSSKDDAPTLKTKKQRTTGRSYVPRHRSVKTRDQTATRATLKQAAALYTDTSFDIPAPGTRYTAWSSMKLLLSKELVIASGRPLIYNLTDAGNVLAEQLSRTEGLFTEELVRRHDELLTNNDTTEEVTSECTTRRPLAIIDTNSALHDHSSGVNKSKNSANDSGSFIYSFLSIDDVIVSSREQAEKLVDPITSKVRYRICFTDLMAKHRIAALVFRKSKWQDRLNYWTGYLDEVECSMASTSMLASDDNAINDRCVSNRNGNSVASSQRIPNPLTSDDAYEPSISFTAQPGTFDIILLIDNRELNGRKESDALWIARAKTATGSIIEMLLDVVLERKQIDDLIASIKDGRYHEQNSGLAQIIYLIEGYTVEAARAFDLDRIDGILASVQVSSGFFLKKTRTIEETVDYLAAMTQQLEAIYKEKRLHAITIETDELRRLNLERHAYNERHPSEAHLINYEDYAVISRKTTPQSIKHTTMLMLMAIKGVSAEKASIIVQKYPSPQCILEALLSAPSERMRQQLFVHDDELVLRRKIGVKLSERIAQHWLGNL
ncbi:hypothetical protein BDF22DRAFT_741730 [Syncephalis plumigaleata]|nr:hypothetical protein BDF22DRAFT_741730 [Syncephalis plumigaleata]